MVYLPSMFQQEFLRLKNDEFSVLLSLKNNQSEKFPKLYS